jgi:hypothetical protein
MDNIQYLASKQVRPVIKSELIKMKNTINEAILNLDAIPSDGTEEEWDAIWTAFSHAEEVNYNIAEMKAALFRNQQWNFVPNMGNNHAQAYAKLAIQSLQENGESISDELREKIVNRMDTIFDDYNEIEALNKAFP